MEQLLTQFQATLDDAIVLAQSFNELLEKEKKQLTSTQFEAVTALLHDKEKLTDTLVQYQATILTFCSKVGIEPNYGSLRSYLYKSGIKEAEQILTDWNRLKNALIKGHALNKTNETILKELMRRNQIKQTWLKNIASPPTDTYTRGGQTNSGQPYGWVEQV